MKWLHYEFANAPEGSHNYYIGELVKQVRYYTENVPAEEFRDAVPLLKEMEMKLQGFDASIGAKHINYIEEIMAELSTISETEELLLEEVTRLSKTIIGCGSRYEAEFALDVFNYDLYSFEAAMWLYFNGYQDEKKVDDYELRVVKEVFRSVCSKYSVVFIDNTIEKPYVIPPDEGEPRTVKF